MKLKKTSRLSNTVGVVDVSAEVGSAVYLDDRPSACRLLTLCEHWDEADFMWEVFALGPVKAVAVNVYVTGRTVQYKSDGPKIRVKVEFVGDGEPSTFANGWMYYKTAKKEYTDTEVA